LYLEVAYYYLEVALLYRLEVAYYYPEVALFHPEVLQAVRQLNPEVHRQCTLFHQI
jgi:hypothetical protein